MNEVKNRFYSGLQTIAGKAGQLGHFEIYYGGYERLFTVMDAYQAVKLPQVQEAAKKYFTENNKTVGRLVPEGGAK
jgi:predicted Zn-dependent peptidase